MIALEHHIEREQPQRSLPGDATNRTIFGSQCSDGAFIALYYCTSCIPPGPFLP